jgi:hypothetical protein
MGTPASSGLSVSPARPAAPVQPKAPVVIDQSDMYTNVFSRFADRHTKGGEMIGMFIHVSLPAVFSGNECRLMSSPCYLCSLPFTLTGLLVFVNLYTNILSFKATPTLPY